MRIPLMRFVIDENMPRATTALLRGAGHDVIAIAEVAPKLPDPEILAWAVRDNRILTTFDTDFGSLIYRQGLPAPPAVILFRLPTMPRGELSLLIAQTLTESKEWSGYFWVVMADHIRQRPLPLRQPPRRG